MSQASRDAFAKAEADLKISREQMAEMNAKVMEAQNNARPEPSIETLQKATAPRAPRPVVKANVDESTINKETASETVTKDDDTKDDKVEKTSTADTVGSKYKTRDMSARK